MQPSAFSETPDPDWSDRDETIRVRAVKMDYEGFFKQRLDALRAEGRYRVFADLERRCGRFPRAFEHRIGPEVTVWCSNDYLGMGQHPFVFAVMYETLRAVGAGGSAISRATAMCICCSSASFPICTGARRH